MGLTSALMRTQRVISVVGCHAEGEVGDVIVGGVLPPAGLTMYDKMRTMERDHDDIRRLLLCEPRGSVARHLNLIVPSTRDDCDFGVIIMEPTEYVPMSGSNMMCTVTVALETGIAHHARLRALTVAAGFSRTDSKPDLSGRDRFVLAFR